SPTSLTPRPFSTVRPDLPLSGTVVALAFVRSTTSSCFTWPVLCTTKRTRPAGTVAALAEIVNSFSSTLTVAAGVFGVIAPARAANRIAGTLNVTVISSPVSAAVAHRRRRPAATGVGKASTSATAAPVPRGRVVGRVIVVPLSGTPSGVLRVDHPERRPRSGAIIRGARRPTQGPRARRPGPGGPNPRGRRSRAPAPEAAGMGSPPLHGVAVVGVHNTRQARVLEGTDSRAITLEAARGALDDAGLDPRAVDGVAGQALDFAYQ